jgi:kynureninase
MKFENTLKFAKEMDRNDPLKKFRSRFFIPKHKGRNVIYLNGNSLGLQPKTVAAHILRELSDWAKFGVEGHFNAEFPWYSYHEQLAGSLSRLCGATEKEVIAMNQLTSNLHFLFVSFYRPIPKRSLIICEAKAFPSDQYLLESQVRFHGFDPKKTIIEISPRKGEHILRTSDILDTIQKHRNDLALVFIGGVNYYTGQVMDMKAITRAAHEAGALAGFDLAHAMGNVRLNLHKWNVDFAAWCSYKYLNSGPGSVGGAFIHSRHHKAKLPRFAGWWGHDKNQRFKMEKGFSPIPTAEGWALSNAPVLSMAAHKAALEIFDEAGTSLLFEKSKKLIAYLRYILEESDKTGLLEILTPEDAGSQISISMREHGKEVYNKLVSKGVMADWREPSVIRVAPVPLYNSFEDVYRFGDTLKKIIFSLCF